MPVTIHRMTIAGVYLAVSIQSDVKQAACDQRLHAADHPVRHARDQGRADKEARCCRAYHRERHTPDCGNWTWCALNGDNHCEANRKTVKHHCPRQKTGVILQRQDGTVHDQVGRDRQSDKPQRANAPIPEAVSEPGQDESNQRQDQSEEAYLFDHVRHDHEQTDAANDHQREAIKQLTRRPSARPSIVQTGPTSSASDAASSNVTVIGVPRLHQYAEMFGISLTC